jgi:hypothetical protein
MHLRRQQSERAESEFVCSRNPERNSVVRLKGLEPLTLGSEDRCSIQLSYRRNR